MRLRDLRLTRFGHFSDLTLDFASEDKRFHVIYGPNEAGKSTALRAISALLFGVPERTNDDHVHQARDLRIGAELESGSGERLTVVRRKGRKGTLLDAQGDPIDEARLTPYLGGVSREVFEAMFGMDHERLVAGGHELLEGRGELGEALFGAAAGLRGLHRLVESLEEEAAGLFKPNAQNPPLNRALAEHRSARARVAELSVKPAEWERVRTECDESRAAIDRVREESARTRARLEDRSALKTALPDLRERAALRARRDEMGEVVRLPEEAAERRRQAEEAVERVALDTLKRTDEQTRLETELAGLAVPEALLALEARAEKLAGDRAVHVKAADDRRDLHSKVEAGEAELRDLARALPRERSLDELDALRLDAASQVRIRELARDGGTLQGHIAALLDTAGTATRRAAEEEAALAALPPERDATALRSNVDTARKAGDLEAQQIQLETERTRKLDQAERASEALPLWSGAPEAAVALPVPSDETVEHFEQQLGRIAEERRALDERRAELDADRGQLEQKLAGLESEGGIPSSADLAEARGTRDDVWSRVRGVWLEGARDASPPEALAGEYEAEVVQSDALADRMFAEHTRVAEIATLRGLVEQNAGSTARVAEERADVDHREAEQSRAWAAAWAPAGVQPATPREMRGWKAQHERLRALVDEIGDLGQEIEKLDRGIAVHRLALLAALAELGEPALAPGTRLAAVLEATEGLLREIDRSREERQRRRDAARNAERERERCDREVTATKEKLAAWRARWREAIAPLDLGAEAEPAEAEAVLDKLVEIFAKRSKIQAQRERIQHIERDAAAFVAELDALVRDGCPELPPLPPAERSAELLARLQRGREDRAKSEARQTRLREIEAELQEIARERESAEATLASLSERAGVSDARALEEAERRSAELAELDRRLAEIDERLLRVGKPIDTLAAEAAQLEDGELILEIDRLQETERALVEERDERNQKLARLERDLHEMDGGEAAAEAAREAEEALARIAHLAAEFARRQAAAVVLRRELQRFADENQGPILSRTSELFARMTRGRYESIQSGFSDNDETVLFCNRADGDAVGVDGLSDGSRDQLYLALRLAALEHHMRQSEPMPLIVDDVLVTFDDPRSAATLELMGELSAESQILFFTHHARLVELAREVIPKERLAVHELAQP